MSDPRYYLRGLGAEAEPAASLFPSYSGTILLVGIVAAVLLGYGMRREHRKLRRKRRPGQFFKGLNSAPKVLKRTSLKRAKRRAPQRDPEDEYGTPEDIEAFNRKFPANYDPRADIEWTEEWVKKNPSWV